MQLLYLEKLNLIFLIFQRFINRLIIFKIIYYYILMPYKSDPNHMLSSIRTCQSLLKLISSGYEYILC